MTAPQDDPIAQLRALFLVLEQVQTIRYTDVACIALGAWEQTLAFQSEMKYIWTMPWSAVKGISFFIRYSFLPFMILTLYESNGIVSHTDGFCKRWFVVGSFWTFFVYASMHCTHLLRFDEHALDLLLTLGSVIAGLVLLRVYAYYGRSQQLFWVLSSLWTIAFCATFAELTVAVKEIIPTSQFEPILKLCIAVLPTWMPAIHCAFLVLEFPLLVMIIRKYRHDIQQTLHAAIINRFIHDGLIYFFIVFGLILWNVFFGLFAPPVCNVIPRHWSMVILTICAHRLVINLRRIGEKSHRPHGLHESDDPSLNSSGVNRGKKRAVGSLSTQPSVAASYPLSSGFSGTTPGVPNGFGVIDVQRRGSESAVSANGRRQHTARTAI